MILKLYWPGKFVAEEGTTGVEREEVEGETRLLISGTIDRGSYSLSLKTGEINQSINKVENQIK